MDVIVPYQLIEGLKDPANASYAYREIFINI